MSKKRDRNKSQKCNCPKCQNKSGGGLANNPFGINPSQLMGMLGNIDMGEIGNILSSMNKDGFDLNNLNLGSVQNTMNGMDGMNGGENNQNISSIQNMMSGMGTGDKQNLSYNNSSHNRRNRHKGSTDEQNEDENIELLMSIRNIVDYNKVKFIDKIIRFYNSGAFDEE